MASFNRVILMGNLTRDPELRFTPSGAAVANFGLAVNRSWKNQQTNEWEEEVTFLDVVCWRQLAENVAESLSKGTRVVVYGRLEQRSWETGDGERRSKVEIIADDVAPSLRWATAELTRNDFKGDAGGAPSGAPNRGGSGRAVPNEPMYDTDEEPF